jgi:hypothetical protein
MSLPVRCRVRRHRSDLMGNASLLPTLLYCFIALTAHEKFALRSVKNRRQVVGAAKRCSLIRPEVHFGCPEALPALYVIKREWTADGMLGTNVLIALAGLRGERSVRFD